MDRRAHRRPARVGGPFRIVARRPGPRRGRARPQRPLLGHPAVLDQLVLRRLDAAGDGRRAGRRRRRRRAARRPSAADPHRARRAARRRRALQPAPQPSVTQLGMRADAGPLADPRARQGIARADRPGGDAGRGGPDGAARRRVRAGPVPARLRADGARRRAAARTRRRRGSCSPRRAGAGPDRPAGGRSTGSRSGSSSAPRPSGPRTWPVAALVADQLDAAGIDAIVVAPPAVELFGQPAVPATPPTPTPTPTPDRHDRRGASADAPPTPPRPARLPATRSGTVRVGHDGAAAHRRRRPGHRAGLGLRLPAAHRADRPAPAGFCFAALQPAARRPGDRRRRDRTARPSSGCCGRSCRRCRCSSR